MTVISLEKRYLEKIQLILSRYPEIEKALIFGSRALGTQKTGSDVDVVLFGDISDLTLGKIRNQAEDTTMPYFFDIITYSSIANEDLREHIDKYGQQVYKKI